MGAWLSRAYWASDPREASSPNASSTPKRPPSPTSTLRYASIRRPRRVEPLPPSIERVYRGRKHERIVVDARDNVRRFVFAGCEDCVVYAPCCADEIEILDCKRCAFAFGATRGGTRVRDSHACDVFVMATIGEIRLEDSRACGVRARGVGSNARFEAIASPGATLGDCDYEYDGAEAQMASSGFYEAGVVSEVCTAISDARGFVVDERVSAYERIRTTFADCEPAPRPRSAR